MSSKIIIEETTEAGTYRLSAARVQSVTSFAIMLAERGTIQLGRDEAEFIARALRSALEALPVSLDEVPPLFEPEHEQAPKVQEPAENAQEKPARAGKRWEKDEDQRLITQFKSKVDYRTIAKEFGRTPTAIIERLLFHKLVTVTPTDQPQEGAAS